MSGKNIVGGRLPGCGTSVGKIPRGIEILVKKASVDPEFKELPIKKRADAAVEIELELNAAEKAMLNVIPEMQIRMIIERTKIEPRQRTAFLGKAAALMIVALGASVLTGCDQNTSKGIQPDKPQKDTKVTQALKTETAEQTPTNTDPSKMLALRMMTEL